MFARIKVVRKPSIQKPSPPGTSKILFAAEHQQRKCDASRRRPKWKRSLAICWTDDSTVFSRLHPSQFHCRHIKTSTDVDSFCGIGLGRRTMSHLDFASLSSFQIRFHRLYLQRLCDYRSVVNVWNLAETDRSENGRRQYISLPPTILRQRTTDVVGALGRHTGFIKYPVEVAMRC